MTGTLCNKSRLRVALPVLALGMLATSLLDRAETDNAARGTASNQLHAPELSMTLDRGGLSIVGVTGSSRQEQAVATLVAQRFPDHEVHREFRAGVLLPEHWEPASVRLLYVMAAMQSASAILNPDQVVLRGVTTEPERFRQRLDFLRQALPNGGDLLEEVVVIDDSLTLDELCRRAFEGLGPLPVAFEESSADLKRSSYPSLDKLVNFAWNCRDAKILIAGHTDASGNEAWNRQLSRARAAAVAEYLAAQGVQRARLVVEGRGSAEPVADNGTRYGRSLNRRIEFELR